MNLNKYIMVLTTIDDFEKGKKISKIVVDKKLAACVQIIGPIQSIYFWRGKTEESKEWLILMKTKMGIYKDLEELIIKMHPYVTPEIIYFKIEGGLEKYFKWIDNSLEGKEYNNNDII